MAANRIIVAGNLGVLVAILFVVFEIVLIPLFEHTRERLTVTAVRRRLASGSAVSIGPERSLPHAFGLSDGIAHPSAFAALPRLLKTCFKIALILSFTVYESQLQTVQRATPAVVPFAAEAESFAVVAPLPVQGVKSDAVHALGAYGKERANATRSYSVKSTPGIDMEYPAHCVSTEGVGESRNRTLFFGVYGPIAGGPARLACLNGTKGRERAPILTYNPDGRHTILANITSVRLIREVANDGLSSLYDAEAVIAGEGPLAGNHFGFVCVTHRTHLSKNVHWSMYGLVLHRSRGTVLRISVPLSENRLCVPDSAFTGDPNQVPEFKPVLLGVWNRSGENFTCPAGMQQRAPVLPNCLLQRLSDVQDVGLRFASSDIAEIGPPLDVLRAWLAEIPWYMFRSNKLFTSDLRDMIQRDIFFFSLAKLPVMKLHIGRMRNHVQMAKWSSVLLFAVITAVVLYCIISFIVEVLSRSTTGIASECISREAVLNLLREEANAADKLPHNNALPLSIGLMNVDADKQRIGVVSKRSCAIRDKGKIMLKG